MNLTFKLALVFFLLLTLSCKERHLFSDQSELATVTRDFEDKQKALPHGDLFRIFTTSLTTEEREALMFLYAYMPIGDITDYSGDYYLMNVRYALKTRQEMPWGNRIPEREFRHFVLPVRVNNENLDESRKVFYKELKERVKNLSLYDAILEVNHWCHEKVIYTPSDSRTSSPLASVKTAYGRCGEESTFLVAALRSVGSLGRRTMAFSGSLRTGTGIGFRLVQCTGEPGDADAHQSIRSLQRPGRSHEPNLRLYRNQCYRQLCPDDTGNSYRHNAGQPTGKKCTSRF